MTFFTRITILLFICGLWNTLSCSIIGSGNKHHERNFTAEGFLDTDHFQAIITGYPDKKQKGLVDKRQSSIEKAKLQIKKTVIDKLSTYCIKHQVQKKGIASTATIPNLTMKTIEIKQKLYPFLKYGQVAFRYYNEDHSAVIVYRIVKEKLKKDIESIDVALAPGKKSHPLP